MKEIYILVDYKASFGLKHFAKPYRSGMDRDLLTSYFASHGYKLTYINFNQVNNNIADLIARKASNFAASLANIAVLISELILSSNAILFYELRI